MAKVACFAKKNKFIFRATVCPAQASTRTCFLLPACPLAPGPAGPGLVLAQVATARNLSLHRRITVWNSEVENFRRQVNFYSPCEGWESLVGHICNSTVLGPVKQLAKDRNLSFDRGLTVQQSGLFHNGSNTFSFIVGHRIPRIKKRATIT